MQFGKKCKYLKIKKLDAKNDKNIGFVRNLIKNKKTFYPATDPF